MRMPDEMRSIDVASRWLLMPRILWALVEAVLLNIRIAISLILHHELESFNPIKT